MEQDPNRKVKRRSLYLDSVPFTWQETKIFQKIREHYQGEKRTTALAIYTTMTEFASLAGRGQGRHVNCFKAHLKTIADRCGKSSTTIKRYLKEFRELDIISWKNHRAGLMNLSNEWFLLSYNQSPNEPTSIHNNGPVIRNLIKRSSYNKNKRNYKNYKGKGFVHIKDTINEQYK